MDDEQKIQHLRDLKLGGAGLEVAAENCGVRKGTITSFLSRQFTTWSRLLLTESNIKDSDNSDTDREKAIVACALHLDALHEHHSNRAPQVHDSDVQPFYSGGIPQKASVATFTFPANAA